MINQLLENDLLNILEKNIIPLNHKTVYTILIKRLNSKTENLRKQYIFKKYN